MVSFSFLKSLIFNYLFIFGFGVCFALERGRWWLAFVRGIQWSLRAPFTFIFGRGSWDCFFFCTLFFGGLLTLPLRHSTFWYYHGAQKLTIGVFTRSPRQ